MNAGKKRLILGSGSPRRKQLLLELFPDAEVRLKDVNEDFPEQLEGAEIPLFLAEQKAKAYKSELAGGEILITADTIVWFEERVLNKPIDHEDALGMLERLSGNTHKVFTGISITTIGSSRSFSVESEVTFIKAGRAELLDYIDTYRPFDKAGSYGAQECLPAGMNPLSKEEKAFLIEIGKPDLFEKSLAVKDHARVALIKSINGSYFNVMGLPLVELWEELKKDV